MWLGLRVYGRLCAVLQFIKWTEWTLAMAWGHDDSTINIVQGLWLLWLLLYLLKKTLLQYHKTGTSFTEETAYRLLVGRRTCQDNQQSLLVVSSQCSHCHRGLMHHWLSVSLQVHNNNNNNNNTNKLCAWRHNMPPSPANWQYLRIYSPGGTCSGMLAI